MDIQTQLLIRACKRPNQYVVLLRVYRHLFGRSDVDTTHHELMRLLSSICDRYIPIPMHEVAEALDPGNGWKHGAYISDDHIVRMIRFLAVKISIPGTDVFKELRVPAYIFNRKRLAQAKQKQDRYLLSHAALVPQGKPIQLFLLDLQDCPAMEHIENMYSNMAEVLFAFNTLLNDLPDVEIDPIAQWRLCGFDQGVLFDPPGKKSALRSLLEKPSVHCVGEQGFTRHTAYVSLTYFPKNQIYQVGFQNGTTTDALTLSPLPA